VDRHHCCLVRFDRKSGGVSHLAIPSNDNAGDLLSTVEDPTSPLIGIGAGCIADCRKRAVLTAFRHSTPLPESEDDTVPRLPIDTTHAVGRNKNGLDRYNPGTQTSHV